jgi:diacylglycerol kinase
MSARSVVNPVTTSANSTDKNAFAASSEVRDELVRAVMPELRVLMQHLVNTAVERSIAPLLEKQHELEAALKDMQNAQLRSARSANTLATHVNEPALAVRGAPIEANPFVAQVVPNAPAVVGTSVPTVAVSRPVVSVRREVLPAAVYDTNSLADIPAELNGARRKKVVAFAFAVVVAVLLLSVIFNAVLSNMRN